MTAKATLELSLNFRPTGKPRPRGQTMRVLMVANFSGDKANVTNRKKLQSVDIDTFDNLLESIGPEATITSNSLAGIKIQVSTLDDFHPDELYENLPAFGELSELRRRLKNPATFKAAAAEIMGGLTGIDSDRSTPASSNLTAEESAEDAIERLLGRSASTGTGEISKPSESMIDSMIRNLVAPHIAPGKDPQQEGLVRSIDASISALMDQVLHAPEIQSLEARWRALHSLVSNPDLDDSVEFHIWDTTHEHLSDMLQHPDGEPMASDAAKLLDGTDRSANWSLVVSDLTFSETEAEMMLAARFAAVTCQFGSPLIACASPSLYGCSTSIAIAPDSDEWLPGSDPALAYWQQLRRSPIAAWIALVSPRLLQRMPYGAKTDPVGVFAYEEFALENHESLLWGPSHIACRVFPGQMLKLDKQGR